MKAAIQSLAVREAKEAKSDKVHTIILIMCHYVIVKKLFLIVKLSLKYCYNVVKYSLLYRKMLVYYRLECRYCSFHISKSRYYNVIVKSL